MEELTIDWPVWGRQAKALLLSSSANHNITLAPGVLLCRRLETRYGQEMGAMLRLGTPGCYRKASAWSPADEVEGWEDSWWEDRLRELYLEALLSPVRVQSQQEAVDFQTAAPPAIFWLSDTSFAYVPEDHFFRAFAAAEKGRLERNQTPQETP